MDAFIHFLTREWYFATPMILMSLAGLTLVIWRFLLNMNARTDMNEFFPQFQKRLEKDGVEGAIRLCREQPGLIPRKLFTAGLENAKSGLAAMKRAMATEIELIILPELNFLLAPILAIAKIATMVGLLFTVISMINTFSAISKAQSATGVAAQGSAIGLALFATAFGLVTAIPLVFMHVLFKDWIHRYEIRMKYYAQKLILLVQNTKPAAGKSTPASTSSTSSSTPAAAKS